MVKDILIKDFFYPLPDELIAEFPLKQRDACRLIVSDADGGIMHRRFSEIPSQIPSDTLMVCNETRVINARMEFHKATGARIEIFLLEPSLPADYAVSFAQTSECEWVCLVGNRKKWKEGAISKQLDIDGVDKPVTLYAEAVGDTEGRGVRIRFSWDNDRITFASIVEAAGSIPIPPYLNRESQESDTVEYQTVFSRVRGSVAAPTAGLHFTDELMSRLQQRGVEIARLTLHVGAGTFQPVKSDKIGDHPMHTETFTVSRQLVESLIAALEHNRTIMAVGTTSVRTLESLPYLGMLLQQGEEHPHITQWMAYDESLHGLDTIVSLRSILKAMDESGQNTITASTAIMIAPGFRWRIVNRMVTNFHQPQSTLLLLVSSFLNPDAGGGASDDLQWKKIYCEALRGRYRFLSYGDACLLSPCK